VGIGPTPEQVESWSAIFTVPDVWSPLVAEVMRREGLGSLESMEAGLPGSNAVFIVNSDLVVKLFWPRFEDDQGREVEAHRLLRARPEIPAPLVLAAGLIEDDLPWRYVVFERLPGLSLGEVRGQVPRADMRRIADEFGDIVRAIHTIAVPEPPSPLARDHQQWRNWVEEAIRAAPERHAADLARVPRMRDELPGFLASAELTPPGDALRVLHCDLTADHLLVEDRDGRWRVSGLIDFGDAEVGHVDYEWVALHPHCFAYDHELTSGFLRAYGYPFDRESARRATACCFLHRFATIAPVLAAVGMAGPDVGFDDLVERLWGGVCV